MRKRIMRIITALMSLSVVAGAVFTLVVMNHKETRENTTVIELEGEGVTKTETVSFEELSLHPGETVGHTVELTNKIGGACKITLDLVEDTEHANELKKYVYVTLEYGEEQLCNMLLSEAFEADIAPIECTLNENDPVIINISYHMPIETGNEAANAEAFFDLVVTASNE